MKKYMKASLGFIVIILIIIGVAMSHQPKDDTITFGFVGPLSGFGAVWGEEQKIAIDIAVGEINQSGGIGGKKIKVLYEDNKCTARDSVTAVQKLISVDKVRLVFSICGEGSLAIAPITQKNKVVVLALWSTHPDLSGIGEYFFRNSYSDEDTGRIMARTVNEGFKRVAVINENRDFSNGIRDTLKKYFVGDIIEENYGSNATDLRSYLIDALSRKPESVIFNPTSPAGGLLALQQLRQLGFKGQVYGNYFGGVGDVLNSDAAEGMIFFSDPFVPDNTIKENLYTKFESVMGRKPNFDFAVSISYDSVYILKRAIEQVGTDTSKIKDYLHNLKDFKGVMGTYGFNDKGDATGYTPSIYQIKDGKVVRYVE
jgi:branched-chain amino acid transport system substrate-binding protein